MKPILQDVTVGTITVTERAALLHRTEEYLQDQTYGYAIRLILNNDLPRTLTDHMTCAANVVTGRNRLLAMVATEWLVTVDDDDVIYPDHIETLWNTHLAHPGIPVIYGLGETWMSSEPRISTSYAMIHVPTVREVGGWVHRAPFGEDESTARAWHKSGVKGVRADRVTFAWTLGDHKHMSVA